MNLIDSTDPIVLKRGNNVSLLQLDDFKLDI
jgi:hypothetical protein